MASSLEAFLSIEPLEEKTETHSVVMVNGQELEVDIKGLTLEQFKRCKKMATNAYDNPNGGMSVAQIEEITFAQKLCANGIVEPSLNNVKLRNRFKVHNNEALVAALFPPQSILKLGGLIANLTLGDNQDVELSEGTQPELIEEAKN